MFARCLRTGQTALRGQAGSVRARTAFRRTYATGYSVPRANSSVWISALVVLAAGAVGSVAFRKPVQSDTKVTSAATTVTPSQLPLIPYAELQKHTSRESCWVLIRDRVFDVTDFLPLHPGGTNIIIKNAGQDATTVFESLHPSGLLDSLLTPEQFVGVIDPTTLPKVEVVQTEDEIRVEKARAEMPSIDAMINIDDIEDVAHNVLSKIAWSYYASTADTGTAQKNNLDAFSKYWFRPRVLRPVRDVDLSTKILGIDSPVPFFVSPAAMAKLGHPLGEINITRGAYRTGIIQGISSNASCTIDEIASARQGDQSLIFQLYVNKDHAASEEVIRKIDRLGFKGIFLTVDAPCLGKRELDMRARGVPVTSTNGAEGRPLTAGVATSLGTYFDANLSWDDLAWIRQTTKLPIIIKGIQCVEDIELAEKYGCDGVLLSNHGGRQLDYAPASIDILWELRQRRPDILDKKKMEIYCDGGFRRGTDVLKVLCLGATAVGLGRPFLFGNGTYGEEGVVKVVELMQQEIATSMRLLGVTKISDLKPEMVRRID